MLVVLQAMIPEPEHMMRHPDDQGHGQGDVEARGGRHETRDQPDHVGDDDVEEEIES